jgi:hypothetical protein
MVRPGAECGSAIRWSYRYSSEEITSGRVSADITRDTLGWLRIQVGGLDQWVHLKACPRHYGGRQWYFLCPETRRRASVLWKPPGAQFFASRQTWGRQVVAYASQFQAPHDRALSAAQEIQYRLGGEACVSNVGDVSPPKPKGMHGGTYERILRWYEIYERITGQYLVAALGRLSR